MLSATTRICINISIPLQWLVNQRLIIYNVGLNCVGSYGIVVTICIAYCRTS